MSVSATSSTEWLAGLATGCEHLIHPSVEPGKTKQRQARLIGVLLVGSFFASAASAQIVPSQFAIPTTLAIVCAVLAAAWLAVALVAVSGRDRVAGPAALAVAVPLGGFVLACAGGAASPLLLLAAGLAVEAWWVGRTRRAAIAGLVAVAGVLLAQAAFSGAGLIAPVATSAWHWLLPVAYASSLFMRAQAWLRAGGAAAGRQAQETLEDRIDAALLRLSRSGEVAHVASRARDLLGVQPELLLGAGLFDRVLVADRVAWLTAFADVREGARERQCEVRLRLPDPEGRSPHGNYRPFSARLMGPDGDGQITVLLRDIGEMAGLRAQLRAALDKAEGNDLARSRFLASVSHELRTPLNAIIGFSDMMLHDLCGAFADPRQREYVGLIRESSNHLLGVVNAILDVSKIESGAYDIVPEPFRFADAAEMCRDMMALQAAAKDISIDLRVAAGVGDVVADRRSVRQMIINLMSNAIKFTPEGGRVALAANRVGSMLHFSVSDNGIGIAEDDLARLGQPFTQVQNDYTRQFDGAGLGLSLVKGLVTLHRGSMVIESAPGEGTTVTISLPADGPAEQPADQAAAPRRKEPVARNGENNATLRKIA